MSGHIIRTFILMNKTWISLGNQFIYESLKMLSHGRVGIFIDGQSI